MDFIKNIITDLKIELSDQFDRNFERKAFFDQKWKPRKREGNGSLMITTGKLRRSIRSNIRGNSIVFSSSMPYAEMHNNGGDITVTPKMKRFFWHKYYEALGGIKYRRDGKMSKASAKASSTAEAYKAMALMKPGSKIHIPQRQLIGHHPKIDDVVKKIVDDNIREIEKELKSNLKLK